MKNAIKLGVGEPCWDEEGFSLRLLRADRKKGLVAMPIRPKRGFKGRDQEYVIWAVPAKRSR